ncbi:hypothetical protein CVT24_000483 [Panaeolus cyanescens]|uniref:Uracil-DNA glycosylase n=1 Tax=Panaeolus cyanescens TaxID=181874 RepID=A0A409VAF3_9AGAR|nr:hypothetical protein CVT24_000483 [Panaeolus cyanescens]
MTVAAVTKATRTSKGAAKAVAAAVIKKTVTTTTAESSRYIKDIGFDKLATHLVSNSPTASGSQTQAVSEALLETLEEDTMEESWRKALSPEFKKPYFIKLKKYLASETKSHTVYPALGNVYSWSRYTPLDKVKVVILGQDPYHDVGQAHGLAFSVLEPTKPPPSLKNIYKQLESDISGFKAPKSGDLSAVAELGVLWLNSSLTVRAHSAGSHAKQGWETFTAEALRAVLKRKNSEQEGVVFMAWGLPAQKTLAKLSVDKKKHLVLESAHPSPLSARRGFMGNEHFKKANEWLVEKYGEGAGIDWTVLCSKK